MPTWGTSQISSLRRRARGAAASLTAVAVAALALAGSASAADRAFTERFSTVAPGDILMTGNTSMTCPEGGTNCAAARNGTASGNDNDNNGHNMAYVDVDSDATTINSSSATVTIPAGATVLWAGLYWGGDSAALDTLRSAVRIDTPAAGGYIDLTADQIDSSTAVASQYGAFENITSQVTAGGSGTYTVANVQGTPATTRMFAGWSIVVAYRLASDPVNHLKVLDGLERPSTTNPTVTIPISNITTPASGTVNAKLGMVLHDGDLATTGEGLTFDGSNLTDALNPNNNQHNSSITREGTRISAKNPDYVNQLGFDADTFSVNGLLDNGDTSTNLVMTSSNNEHYHVTTLTLVNRAETAPPDTTINSGPSGLTSDNTPTWAFSSSEAGSTFECRIDGGAWASCSTPFTPAALSDGAHTFDVRAIDPQLNPDPTPATRSITVDATAPNTTIDSGVADGGSTKDTTPTFTFSSSETGSTFQCSVDGGAYTACTSPFTTGTLAQGSHTFSVRAVDAAGNQDGTPASRTFNVDTAAPALVTLTDSDPDSPANDNNPEIKGSAEAGSTVRLYTNSTCTSAVAATGTAAAFASPGLTVTVGNNSSTTYWATATDAAGNASACSTSSLTYVEDSNAPALPTLTDSDPDSPANDNNPEIKGSAEAGSTVRLYTNNTCSSAVAATGTAAAFSSPGLTVTVGADITTTFYATATDAAGNTSACSTSSLTYREDSTGPDTTITAGVANGGVTGDATPEFSFSSSESPSTFQCRFDSAAFAPCTSPHSPGANLTDGSHTFEVRAIDAAGNVDGSPATRTFTVDTTAPALVVLSDSDPDSPANDNNPAIKGNAENGSIVRLYTNANCTSAVAATGSAASFSSPGFTVTIADDTTTTFYATATDAAGNTGACSSSSLSYREDSTAPNTTIDSGPNGPTSDNTPTFAFSSSESPATFECSVDGGAFAACASPHTTAALGDGPHTIAVRSRDAAGNVDATPDSRSFTVDTSGPAPVVVNDSDPDSPANDNDPEIKGSAENGSTVRIYTNSTCTSAVVATGTAAAFSSPGLTVNVANDTTTTFYATATDAAGNASGCSTTSLTYREDSTAPDTTITGGPSGLTNDPTPSFTFTSSESPATFECRVDSAAFAPCSSPETTASLSDGQHTFEVRSRDAAGNADGSPASRTFTVDATPPETTIDTGPSGPTADPTPTFAFSSNDANATLECSLDGGNFQPCTSPLTTPALADGSHTLEVQATDQAGNTDPTPAQRTFEVDTTGPNTQIDSGPSGPTNDSTPAFTFSSPESGVTYECRVDAGSFAPCTSPHTTATLGDGPHTFQVRAVDGVGNPDPSPASRSFTVDTNAPALVTLTDSDPDSPASDNDPEIKGNAEAGSTVRLYTNSTCTSAVAATGTAAAFSSPGLTVTVASDTTTTFWATATDSAGNTSACSSSSLAYREDSTAPETTITAGVADGGVTGDATPEFGFSSSESGSTFECSVDGGAFAPCASPETTANLGDGQHTFEVRATDQAGNQDATAASRTFTVDTGAPDTTIDSGPSGLTGDSTPAYTFSSNESPATFECSVDGAPFAPCTSPETTASLGDGPHTFEVRAIDQAGNVDPTPDSRSIVVDTTPPQTTIDSGPTGLTNDPTPTFTFSSDEPGSAFECRTDSDPFVPCSSPHTTDPLGNGAHTFEVRAIDPAGNPDPTPAIRATINVDLNAPDTTIDSGPSGPTNDPTPEFEFSSDEPGSTFECRVDSDPFAPCSSPETTASLSDGPHTFQVRATDPAGNVDPSPASRSFTVDTGAPDTTIDSGPSGLTGDSTPAYAFSSDDNGATFECSVDGGAFAPCTSPETTSSLSDGQHTFEVRAVDAAGNADPTPASRTITVDTDEPETTIDSGPSGLTGDTTPEFAFSSDEPGSTFECSVDGGSFGPCSSPHTTASLGDGQHTIEVRATDPAGNTDGTPASRTFTVDATPPVTTIDDGPSGPTNDPTPEFEFSSDEPGSTFECRIDGGSWNPCTSPHTTTNLPDGPHTFEVRAIDPAGNPDGSPESRSFTVDTGAPALVELTDSDPDSAANDNDPEIKGDAENGSTVNLYTNAACTSAVAATGSAASFASPGLTVSVADDSTTTFYATATDSAGNTSACSTSSLTYREDSTAPGTDITGGPSGTTGDNTPTFTFTSTEPGSTFECRIDGGAWDDCSSPHTTGTLGDGPHTIEVRSTDPAGNTDQTPASRSFTVDSGAPNTQIDSGPTGTITDTTPAFAFSSPDEPGSSFECRVDGGGWSHCASPETILALGDGQHTFEVRAVDGAGNVDLSPASRSFTIDTGAPDTAIDSGPSGLTNDPTPTFAFSSDEAGSTYECRVDGGAWVSCSGPRTVSPLPDGQHTFEVRATDGAGNQDGSPASQTITVDTTPPQTAIVTGPSGTITDPNPSFTFSTTEPGSTYECRVDGGAWAACGQAFNPGNLPNGPHTLEVRSIDPAGNSDGSPETRQFTVAAVPAPTPPAETELSGSLLAADSCQQFSTGTRSAKRTVPGVGRVTVKLTTDGTILSASPLTITTIAPRARTRSVRYTLDNVRLRGTNRRLQWSQAVTPAQLAKSSQHSLVVQVKGRGRPTRFTVTFATIRCDAALSAQLKRKGRANEIAMRVDTRTPASAVSFTAPSKYIPRVASGSAPVGSLRIQTPTGATIYPLRFSGGKLVGAPAGTQIALAGGIANVTGLPSGTGVVTLTLKARANRSKPSRKPIPVTARVTTASQGYSLITRMRARR